MRLPMKENGQIDEPQATKMLRYGIDNGVNYVDTAYVYHNGESTAHKRLALSVMINISGVDIVHAIIDGVSEHIYCLLFIEVAVLLHRKAYGFLIL